MSQKLAAEKYDRLFKEVTLMIIFDDFGNSDGDSDGQQLKEEGKLDSIGVPGNDLSRVDDLLLAEVGTNTFVIVFIFKCQALVKMKKANLSDTKLSLKQLQW